MGFWGGTWELCLSLERRERRDCLKKRENRLNRLNLREGRNIRKIWNPYSVIPKIREILEIACNPRETRNGAVLVVINVKKTMPENNDRRCI